MQPALLPLQLMPWRERRLIPLPVDDDTRHLVERRLVGWETVSFGGLECVLVVEESAFYVWITAAFCLGPRHSRSWYTIEVRGRRSDLSWQHEFVSGNVSGEESAGEEEESEEGTASFHSESE